MIIVTFFWGATFVYVKDALDYISVSYFLFYRFLLSFILTSILILIYFFYHHSRVETINKFKKLFHSKGWYLGIFLFLGFFFQTWGLSETSPANAAFITGLSVILVPLLAYFLASYSLSKQVLLATSLALIGLAFLTIDFNNIQINNGDLLILLTALFFALQIIFTDIFVQKEEPLSVALTQFTAMAILSFLSVLIFDRGQFLSPIDFNSSIWSALLLTIVFAAIYAFFVQSYSQKKINPTVIALIFAFEPVFALLTSLVIGDEELTLLRFIGMSFIFIGSIIAIIYSRKIQDLAREI